MTGVMFLVAFFRQTRDMEEPRLTKMDLIRIGPYRIFFPLGILCGILGVGHWVLWSAGWIKESNSFFHASMQVEGFLACFVAGFMMTALPRFSGTSNASNAELAVGVGAAMLFVILSLYGYNAEAQLCFLALIFNLVAFAARRFPHRTKDPPASFALIPFGLLHAVLGSSLILLNRFGRDSLRLMETGRQMLQIGFLLCMVLGIAGYLAPYLTGFAADPRVDPGAGFLRRFTKSNLVFHAVSGALIIGSFFLGPAFPRPAPFLRATVALAHFNLFGKIYRWPKKRSSTALLFWLACWMVPAGLWGAALWPDYRIAALHVLFIGGFSLMIFSFGLLVVLSHGAQTGLLSGPLIPLKIVGLFVLAAMVLRVTADIEGWHYQLWIHMASGLWVIAAALWLIYIFPKLWSIPALDEAGRPKTSYGRGPV